MSIETTSYSRRSAMKLLGMTAALTAGALTIAPRAEANGTGGTTTAPKPTGSNTYMDKFVAANKGKTLANIWGYSPGECVSLVHQYLNQRYKVQITGYNDATNYRPGFDAGNQLKRAGFKWHTDKNFKNGDIVVWYGGGALSAQGHIGLWYQGKIFDQNNMNSDGTWRRYAGFSKFFTANYAGYWRK